jgi:hypothetical protein
VAAQERQLRHINWQVAEHRDVRQALYEQKVRAAGTGSDGLKCQGDPVEVRISTRYKVCWDRSLAPVGLRF